MGELIPLSERTSLTTRTKLPSDYPQQFAQHKGSEWESVPLFGSFENKVPIASPVTSASSAGTSTNTSFSARSLATSFDSSIDGADTAKGGYWDNPPCPSLFSSVGPGSESYLANRYESEASSVSTAKFRAPPEPMDIDSESIKSNKTAFKAELRNLPGQIEPRSSSTLVEEQLAVRLHGNSPFGNLFPSLMFCVLLLRLVENSSSPRSLSVSAIATTLRDHQSCKCLQDRNKPLLDMFPINVRIL